jgi:hypothetical protein
VVVPQRCWWAGRNCGQSPESITVFGA